MDFLDIAIAKALGVAANQGAENEGKILAVSGDGSVVPVAGSGASVTTAGDVTYSKVTTYSDGTVGSALGEMAGDIEENASDILDNAADITELQSDFDAVATVTVSPNLYNPGDPDVLTDKYINPNGSVETVSNRLVTGFIPVSSGQTLIMSRDGEATPWSSTCFYQDNKSTVVSGGAYNTNGITVPVNAKYVRVTLAADFTNVQIECNADGSVSNYQPYGQTSAGINYGVVLPGVKAKKTPFYKITGNLSNGQFFKSTARTDVRKNNRVVFTADITTFSSITIAKSYNVYPDNISTPRNVFVIDGTNITYKFDGTNAETPQAHGLTITNNIQVILEESDIATCKVTLISNGNIYTHTFNYKIYEIGSFFVLSTNSTLTNCEFVWMCADIDKLVWIFGDSYCQYTTDRWAYYLHQYGFDKNALIDAYSGEASSSAYNSYKCLLEYGTPTFAIWCMGMNDLTDSGDTPSSDWVTGRDKFLTYCDQSRVTPIFGTIPSVPNINHEAKNSWIRSSGYRYIDFAKAVGAQSNGTWYAGMLSTDNVHPTEEGARALFAQFLADFPEIMLNIDVN
jgi:hypothetical protein